VRVSEERWWTVEEADAALPRITVIVEDAIAAAARARESSAGFAARVRSNGHGSLPADLSPIQDAIDALSAEGIVLRDIDRGLIDFTARAVDGRPYWLCWVVGEPSVAWWHWPEDGFAGRKPIADAP
jgi:hypothetical protein